MGVAKALSLYFSVRGILMLQKCLLWSFIHIYTDVIHGDVIKCKHFPRYWPFVRGIHRSPVNSPHKGQWRGTLMFSLICVWINDWVNNREAGDLRRHRGHCDVNVMQIWNNGMENIGFTHWGRVTHICVSKLTIIGSYNGLSPGRHQANIWTNAGILSIRTLGTNFSEILSGVHTFSFRDIHLTMPSGKRRPFCLGLDVLINPIPRLQMV